MKNKKIKLDLKKLLKFCIKNNLFCKKYALWYGGVPCLELQKIDGSIKILRFLELKQNNLLIIKNV